MVDIGLQFQSQFSSLCKKVAGSKKKNHEYSTPKIHTGTIKKYLTDTQNHILCLLQKHLLESKNHPIYTICQMFRENFGKAYEKYSKPLNNSREQKAGLVQIFKIKTK